MRQLRDFQDWTGIRVVVVFDGRGQSISHEAEPGEIQIFYSRAGQTADSIIERLASKYAERFHLLVATGDYLEQETASASGAETISPEGLRELLRTRGRRASDSLVLGRAEQGGADAGQRFAAGALPAGREDAGEHAVKLLDRQDFC